MLGFLRVVGIVNAAIWFGAIAFFTFAAAPAFFSPEMTRLLGRPHAGAAAQLVVHRYFIVQQICAAIALMHLIGEWLYTGRPLNRLTLILVSVLFFLGVVAGSVLEPKMRELHLKMYAVEAPTAMKESSRRAFGLLHGTSSVLNLLVMAGVLVYLLGITKPVTNSRFASAARFTT